MRRVGEWEGGGGEEERPHGQLWQRLELGGGGLGTAPRRGGRRLPSRGARGVPKRARTTGAGSRDFGRPVSRDGAAFWWEGGGDGERAGRGGEASPRAVLIPARSVGAGGHAARWHSGYCYHPFFSRLSIPLQPVCWGFVDNGMIGRRASREARCWAWSLLYQVSLCPRHAGTTPARHPTTHHRHRHGALGRATAGRRRVAAKGDGGGRRPASRSPPFRPSAQGGAAAPRSSTGFRHCLRLAGEGRPSRGGGACRPHG